MDTFYPPQRQAPWYEPWVVGVSVTVFLVYFCILREENDIDEKLGDPLFKNVPQLEEPTLVAAIEAYKRQGKDSTELQKRLEEIRAANK